MNLHFQKEKFTVVNVIFNKIIWKQSDFIARQDLIVQQLFQSSV